MATAVSTARSPPPGKGLLGRVVGDYKPLDADVRDKVLKQLEFYFSDSNLPRDK